MTKEYKINVACMWDSEAKVWVAQSDDLRRMQITAVCCERHGDGVEQAGTIRSADRQDEVHTLFVGLDRHRRLNREVLDLA